MNGKLGRVVVVARGRGTIYFCNFWVGFSPVGVVSPNWAKSAQSLPIFGGLS